MLYLTEDASAWVAVKYTTSNSAVMVENQWNASSRNYYVSQSILASAISVATDIIMVESRSSVYSSMSNAADFSAIRGNILNGCLWFRDTHAFTFTTATPMPSDGSIFLHESNVVISYFLKKQYQSRWCTNDASACQHLLVHFESPLRFDKTPQMPPTHCGDDVSTTFAKGRIEYIAVDLIAHGNEDFLTGARIAVPETTHVTRLTNARYGSRCIGDYALPK
jgi:hypothetical protein